MPWYLNPQAWFAIGMWMVAAGVWLHVFTMRRKK